MFYSFLNCLPKLLILWSSKACPSRTSKVILCNTRCLGCWKPLFQCGFTFNLSHITISLKSLYITQWHRWLLSSSPALKVTWGYRALCLNYPFLSGFLLHSIPTTIKPGVWKIMHAALCDFYSVYCLHVFLFL